MNSLYSQIAIPGQMFSIFLLSHFNLESIKLSHGMEGARSVFQEHVTLHEVLFDMENKFTNYANISLNSVKWVVV